MKFPFTFAYISNEMLSKNRSWYTVKSLIYFRRNVNQRERETIEINRKTNHKLQAVFVIMTNANWSTNNQCPLYSHKHKLTPNQPLIYITN